MSLAAIAYTSSATSLVTDESLERLLEKTRRINEALGVTGVLLFHEGSFLQYIEGPSEGIDAVFERICRSPMHTDVTVLMREPIDRRSFGEWFMGFTRAPHSTVLQLSNASWRAHLDREKATEATAASDGLSLLLRFWNSNRGFM